MTRFAPVRRAALLLGVSAAALAIATPSFAQDTVPQTAATPADEAEQAPKEQAPSIAPTVQPNATEARGDNEIVVTGTRIRQPEFTSPDPVSSIDPKISKREGKFDTAETLQSSPIAAGSTQVTAAISANLVTNGGPGAQTIDLRGLGPNRTLVLLNGRRAGPAGTRGGVSSFDLNVLPQSIISRVDILKTGASSIYGSDAVAGVVNIITDTDRDGFELDGSASVPFSGAGQSYQISGSWGKKFDRGHILIAADYYRQKELARGDLKYLGCPQAYIFTDESHHTRADLVDPRTGKYHCEDFPWGHVWVYEDSGQLYTTTGRYTGNPTLFQYQYPGETLGIPPIDTLGFTPPPGWFPTGYDAASQAVQNDYHPFIDEQSIIPSTTRYTIYGDAAYELSDAIEVYGEFLGNRRKSYQNGWRQLWTYGYGEDVYPDNPWGQGWHGPNVLSPLTITNHYDHAQQVDYWRAVGGLRGNLGGFLKGWSYDAYVQYSHNKGLYKSEQFLQDVYDSTYYQTSSCAGTTLPFSGKQCMDLPFGDPFWLRGEMTPEQIDYMFDWDTGKTIYKQITGEASATGNLFDMPTGAGPVGIALGVTVRRDEIVDTPGDIVYPGPNPFYDPTIPLTDPQCTSHGGGYPFYPCEQVHSNAWGVSSTGITAGHSITKEAFGEIQVPLLKDRPFFRDLSFSGAARITNVKAVRASDGFTDKDTGNWTYKLGGNWAVNRWLRFRATYGTSFRAPALFEQFKANESGFVSASRNDPCRRVDANLAQGNIGQLQHDRCVQELIGLGLTPTEAGNYPGGPVSANVRSQGGIGVLDPETSTAKTASVILTPTFSFLPDTRLSVAVDYFDIQVKGEVSQLGAQAILKQCYTAADFPNPFCALFNRLGPGAADPAQIGVINDKYINIADQQTRGIDVTGLLQHNIPGAGQLSLVANMSWTLKQQFSLFPDQPEDLLGVIDKDNATRTGTRKWVGDFRLSWRAPGGLTFFWGTEIFSGASNEKEWRANNGDSLCTDSVGTDLEGNDSGVPIYGHYCVDVKVPTAWYHNASITKEIGKSFEMTVGMRNIFNKKPPKVSLFGTGSPGTIGPVVATSQYDFEGRRLFVSVSRKF